MKINYKMGAERVKTLTSKNMRPGSTVARASSTSTVPDGIVHAIDPDNEPYALCGTFPGQLKRFPSPLKFGEASMIRRCKACEELVAAAAGS